MHVVLFQSGATGYINKIHFKCICTHAYITYVLCILPKYPQEASFSVQCCLVTPSHSLSFSIGCKPVPFSSITSFEYLHKDEEDNHFAIYLSCFNPDLRPWDVGYRIWRGSIFLLRTLPPWSPCRSGHTPLTGSVLGPCGEGLLWVWCRDVASCSHRAGSVDARVCYQEKSEITPLNSEEHS